MKVENDKLDILTELGEPSAAEPVPPIVEPVAPVVPSAGQELGVVGDGAKPQELPPVGGEILPPPVSAGEPPSVPSAPPSPPPPSVPPVAPTKEEELLATITGLREQLAKVTETAMRPPAVPSPMEPPPGTLPPVDRYLNTEEEVDAALKTVDGVNALLTKVKNSAIESVLQAVPQLVITLADQQISRRTAVNEFYTMNKDLVAYKPFVGFVANTIAAEHPDWGLEKIMTELGAEARKRLALQGIATGVAPTSAPPLGTPPLPPNDTNSPAFVSGPGGARLGPGGQSSLQALEKEIMDLANL